MTGGTSGVRVCHLLAGDQWAGAEMQVADLLRGLAGREGFELSAVLFSEDRLARELRECGVVVHVLDENDLGRLGVLRRAAAVLRRLRPHILHTHRYKGNVIGAIAGRWAGIRRFVRTAHGMMEPWEGFDRGKMGIYDALDGVVDRWGVDRVIAVSSDLAAKLAARVPSERIVVVRNGLDPRRIPPGSPRATRADLGLIDDGPLFGTVGRLTPVKGLEYFVEAARGILEHEADARFVIVGDGASRDTLVTRVRELGLTDRVRFLGFRHDAVRITGALDVFVMPSLHEGLPMALLEAMVLGKPIVASDVGGIPEVLHDDGGWLVPPRDVGALVRACVSAARKRESGDVATLAAARRREIESLARRMCRETEDVYRELHAVGA